MRKIFTFIAVGFGFVSNAFAGIPLGFSTVEISWSESVPTAVPTLGTYGASLLAVLLTLVVYRVLRNRGALVRAIAPLATFGVGIFFVVMSEQPIAALDIPAPIDGSSCNGSETYTADAPTPPPCFVNTCGSPVTVSYTFIDGQTDDLTPITAESCTYDYYCDGSGEETFAIQGALIPSDGLSYGTAYCSEIFSEREQD